MKVTMVGVGHMGEALLAGSLAGGLDAEDVTVAGRHQDSVDRLAEKYGVHGTTDTDDAVAQSDVVVVGTPPAHTLDVVREFGPNCRDGSVVVSLADGVGLEELTDAVPDGVGVARALPSLTSRVGHGVTLVTMGPGASDTQRDSVRKLFALSGDVIEVGEDEHAAYGPISSGGAAHLLYVADAMIEAGAVRGVPREKGREIVAELLAGCAEMLANDDADVPTLRAQICAPGGAGIKRIASLDEQGVRGAFLRALSD